MKLFVVGKDVGNVVVQGLHHFEIIGIYDTEGLAVKYCTTKYHWVAPLELNYTAPEETTAWPGLYYPRRLEKLHPSVVTYYRSEYIVFDCPYCGHKHYLDTEDLATDVPEKKCVCEKCLELFMIERMY